MTDALMNRARRSTAALCALRPLLSPGALKASWTRPKRVLKLDSLRFSVARKNDKPMPSPTPSCNRLVRLIASTIAVLHD